MARKNKMKELQKEMGSLDEIIPPLVNKLGQERAGRKLGVSESTINQWLKSNGYIRVTRYVKEGQAS